MMEREYKKTDIEHIRFFVGAHGFEPRTLCL